jgi:hypothetical protein
MELTRETALLMPKPFGVKCVTVVRKYEPNDLETVVGVFCRSVVRSRAGTIHLPKSLPGHHSHRISPRGLRVLGKAASSCASEASKLWASPGSMPKGSLICFTCIPSFSAKGWPVSCTLNSARGQSIEVSDIFGLR